jgi:phage terminase large subunit GpA-like protein
MLANAERLALDAMVRAIDPPPPIDYLKWACENVVFPEEESSFPGPYNRSLFPYFDEILKALSPDDPCRVVTLAKSAQLGGTVLANIFTCGSLMMGKGTFLYVHPSEGNAQAWSKMKLAPLMRRIPALAEAFPSKSRDVADSVTFKERRDGLAQLRIVGANSAASLSQMTILRQVQDDLAKFEMNSAGDPEAQADSRSRAVEFAKIFKISTPLIAPGCKITRNFEAGSQELPYVPCPHCGEMQVLEWENMLSALDPEKPEDAHFTCVACGAAIEEHHRPQMLTGFEWRAQNPSAAREHRSFWIWSAYSYLQSFELIAREWLKARGNSEAEKVFANDTTGKAFRAQSEAPPWERLRDRAAASDYSRGSIPAGALVFTIGIDCQKDRVEWQLVGWGREFRRYVIDYGIIPGHITEKSCQEGLDGLLRQEWKNAFGRSFSADLVAIDGNAWTEDVWGWARRHPAQRLIMVRGDPRDTAPRFQRVRREYKESTGKKLKYASRFYNFNASIAKMGLYRDLAKDDGLSRGFVGLPRGLDDEYFRQLTAERREAYKRQGVVAYRWVPEPGQANEALDTMNQAECAAIRYGVRGLPDAVWARLEQEREVAEDKGQGDIEDLLPLAPSAPTAPTANSRGSLRRGGTSGFMS